MVEGGEALAVDGGPAGVFDHVLAAGQFEDVVQKSAAADGSGGGFVAEEEGFDGGEVAEALGHGLELGVEFFGGGGGFFLLIENLAEVFKLGEDVGEGF